LPRRTNKKRGSVATGDKNSVLLWCVIALSAAAVEIIVLKKQEKE
jgi:hypothetical protein